MEASHNKHTSSFAADLQYSASSHFHQSDNQWILLPTFYQSFSFIKASTQHFGFPREKNGINLSIFFPPVSSHSASPHFVKKLCPHGDHLGLEVSFQEHLCFPSPVSIAARSSTAMRAVLDISQSSVSL